MRQLSRSRTLTVFTYSLLAALTCRAQDIRPFTAEEVRPYTAEPARPNNNGQRSPGNTFSGRQGVVVSKCASAICELTGQSDAPVLTVSGIDRSGAQGGARLVVFTEDKQPVVDNRVRLGPDGGFRFNIETWQLSPGKYAFGILTADGQDRVIAAGSFTVTAQAASTPATNSSRRSGLGAILDRLNEDPGRRNSEQGSSLPGSAPGTRAASGAGSVFFHTFGLAVPGVVYSTDNYAINTRTTTIASGTVTKSTIRVNSDGTYIWNSAWDGKIIQGRWRNQDGGVLLLNGQSGHDWRMDRLSPAQGKAVIVLYDSSTQYHGTPLD